MDGLSTRVKFGFVLFLVFLYWGILYGTVAAIGPNTDGFGILGIMLSMFGIGPIIPVLAAARVGVTKHQSRVVFWLSALPVIGYTGYVVATDFGSSLALVAVCTVYVLWYFIIHKIFSGTYRSNV
jgi:hypothetical protein